MIVKERYLRILSLLTFVGGNNLMNMYYYEGPVMIFGTCVANNWKSSTCAESENKAKNNLAYQYKKQNGKCPNAKITLPGKLRKEN